MIPMVTNAVHYVSYGTPGGEYSSMCRAAIITQVLPLEGDDAGQAYIEQWPQESTFRVGLCVLNPTGLFFREDVPYDPNATPGTWHWVSTNCG